MSRTIRRKNYERTQGTSWDRAGDKTAGYYTQRGYNYDGYSIRTMEKTTSRYVRVNSLSYPYVGWVLETTTERVKYRHYWRTITYRAPTQQEYNDEYCRIHGDNHSFHWSPGKTWRKEHQTRVKTQSKRELARWIKNPDYDVQCDERVRRDYWD